MQTKLQELTEKIYQEGVNKANKEAEKVLSVAKKEAKDIVATAKKQAKDLLEKAEKEAEETKKNALNELQLSGRQVISDIKQKVMALIEAKIIKPETNKAFEQKDFIPDILATIVKNWNPKGGESVNLEVLLPAERQKILEAYFKGETGKVLQKNLEVQFSEKVKGGFKIGPKDGGYQISFTDKDFENFFQTYLRPRLIDLLFGNGKK